MAVKTSDCIINLSDFIPEGKPIDANKKNALRIDELIQADIEHLSFKILNNRLEVSINTFEHNGKVVISNYSKIKYLKIQDGKLIDLITEGMIDNTENIISTYDAKKLIVTGITDYSDKVDVSDVILNKATKNKNAQEPEEKEFSDKGLTINSGYGHDIVTGTKYSDTINAGNGNDTIYSTAGNDVITGGNGSNTIVYEGVFNTDTVKLTKNEILTIDLSSYGITSVNETDKIMFNIIGKDLKIKVLNFGNIILKDYTNNILNSLKIKLDETPAVPFSINDVEINYTEGDFSVKGVLQTSKYDSIVDVSNLQTAYNDKKHTGISLTSAQGNDNITASKFNDTIKSGKGSDIVYGNDGDDIIYGNSGSDKLFGGYGNDKIHCGEDNDRVFGECGDDIIYGDSGRNAFYFREYDGQDTIYMGKGTDILVFDTNLEGTLRYEKSGNNLIIWYGAHGDSVKIMNYYIAKNKSVDTIIFADYNSQDYDIIDSPDVKRISISDSIIQQGGYKYEYFKYGDKEYLKLYCQVLNGNSDANLIQSSKKYDLINSGAGNDTVDIQSKDAKVTDTSGNDTYNISSLKNCAIITDLSGTDKISINDSSKNINIFFDVAKNENYTDKVVEPSNLFIFNSSELQKFIKKHYVVYTNGIQINDYFGTGVIEKIYSKDYFVTNDEVQEVYNDVKQWLNDNNYGTALEALMNGSPDAKKELLAIYKNIKWVKNTLNGTNKDDTIEGTEYGESIYGKGGNDTINAKGGDDYIDGGDGDDTIETTGGNSTIYGGDGDDIIRATGGNNTIMAGYGNDIVVVGSGKNIINGGDGTNRFTFTSESGNTKIVNGNGHDTLIFSEQQDIKYKKENSSNDLHIEYGDTDILLDSYFADNKFSVKDVVKEGVMSDLAQEVNNKLYIYGNNSKETFLGTNGNDIFVFDSGNGMDTIISSGGQDKIQFNEEQELSYYKVNPNNNLVIKYGNNDKIIIKNYFDENTPHSVQTIINGEEFLIADAIEGNLNYTDNEGSQVINSPEEGITIDLMLGDNTVNYLATSHGDDIIINSNRTDKIVFGIDVQLKYTHNLANNDLKISYSDTDSVTIKDYYLNKGVCIDTIVLNNESLSIVEEIEKGLYIIDSGNGESEIKGTKGDDNITIISSGNTIYGYEGNDTFNDSEGNNTYYFEEKGGRDSVTSANTQNTFNFDTVIENLSFVKAEENKLIITGYGSSNDILTYLAPINMTEGYSKIPLTVVTQDAVVQYVYCDVQVNAEVNGTENNDLIIGSRGTETIQAGGGDDYIYSGAGDDIVYSGAGNDTIDVGDGENSLYFYAGDGHDVVKAGYGNNTLIFDSYYEDLVIDEQNNTFIVSGYGDDNDIVTVESKNSIKSIVTKNKTINFNEKTIIYGTEGNDHLEAEISGSIIYGYGGDDELTGRAGDDTLVGGYGKDILSGGSGKNILCGQYDDDTYWVTLAANSFDTIENEWDGNDTLIIENTKNNVALYYNVFKNGKTDSTLRIKDINCLKNDEQGVLHYLFDKTGNTNPYDNNDPTYTTEYIIETVIINNNTKDKSDDYVWIFNKEQVDNITSQVVSWLYEKDYADVETVIEGTNQNDINEVLGIFGQVWQAPNNQQ